MIYIYYINPISPAFNLIRFKNKNLWTSPNFHPSLHFPQNLFFFWWAPHFSDMFFFCPSRTKPFEKNQQPKTPKHPDRPGVPERSPPRRQGALFEPCHSREWRKRRSPKFGTPGDLVCWGGFWRETLVEKNSKQLLIFNGTFCKMTSSWAHECSLLSTSQLCIIYKMNHLLQDLTHKMEGQPPNKNRSDGF